MSINDSQPLLRLGHSPDPDDAFMWWPLTGTGDERPRIDTGRFRYEAVLADIESLNQRAASGELEITAMSCATWPAVHDRYIMTACGASMGDAYGPKLVAKPGLDIAAFKRMGGPVAVPGRGTSAFAALSLFAGVGTFQHEVVAFEEIPAAVASGRFPFGLVIHEGQLTFGEQGLDLVLDLGSWWSKSQGLPLPLGVNAVRRDLEQVYGEGTLREIARTLRASVDYALAHREEGLTWAMQFGRGIDRDVAEQFVGMYVNHWTLEFGKRGEQAVQRFLESTAAAGLTPAPGAIDFVTM